ncbi:MAG: class I SAM-dependent methyltransferase [Methanospirillum sp.]|uniref:class I SAM-dependent methyltransferase n=1 Tax=Methanospirillum sp. TaxID=45200 RepID=UPI00237197E4|nr:methyltransferase domain-containing protein [Methanospirillum sp.]MDD1728921.1 class I SAM-dependent methyltransferase [Methanospirillum sp.]
MGNKNITSPYSTFKWQMNYDNSETYERYIVPTWMTDLTSDLINAGGVCPKKRVLDVACGTGIVARKAAGIVGPYGRIAAVDLNEGMLRVAGKCAEHEGVNGIEWYHSDVTSMPFMAGEFDTVLCQQGLQFFPDKATALQEMKRVLTPQGTLALNVWGRPENSPHVGVICDVFTEYFGEDSTIIFRAACSLSNPRELRNLVEEAGFSNIQIRSGMKIARHPSLTEFLPAYFSIFPIAAQIAAMPEEERTRMFQSIETNLAGWRENDGFAIPTENYTLTAETGNSSSPGE